MRGTDVTPIDMLFVNVFCLSLRQKFTRDCCKHTTNIIHRIYQLALRMPVPAASGYFRIFLLLSSAIVAAVGSVDGTSVDFRVIVAVIFVHTCVLLSVI